MADNSLAKLFGSSVGLSGKAKKRLPPVRQSIKARRSRSLNNSRRNRNNRKNALSGVLNYYNAMGVPVASKSEEMASLIANQQQRERNMPSVNLGSRSRSGRVSRLTELGKIGLIAKMEQKKRNRNRNFREERRRLAPSMNNLTNAFGRASFGAEGRAAPFVQASASPSTTPFSLAPATFTFGGPPPPPPLGYAQASAQPFSLAPATFGGPPPDENIHGGSYRKKTATRRKKRSVKGKCQS